MKNYPASVAQFSKNGVPYAAGDVLKQPDLARTLQAHRRPRPGRLLRGRDGRAPREGHGAHGGLITRADLKDYQPKKRAPITGTYRGLRAHRRCRRSVRAASALHRDAQHPRGVRPEGGRVPVGSQRPPHDGGDAPARIADRARYLGDPDFIPDRCRSRGSSRRSTRPNCARRSTRARASKSSPASFEWPAESDETTHLSVVDARSQRGVADLHARGRLRFADRRPGRGFPAEQRDGRLQRRPRPDDGRGADRHGRRTWPRPASACSRA